MKIKLLILLIAPLLLMNCKEEDDEGNLYVGAWVGISVEASECNSDGDNFKSDLACDDNSCNKLTLNNDGTFAFQEGLPTRTGTWSVSGTILTLCVNEEDELLCDEYTNTLGSRLILSLVSESTGCNTTITFERESV
ncbi:MAG: hypothetical protein AB8B73_10275 [Ekhidna sp.]